MSPRCWLSTTLIALVLLLLLHVHTVDGRPGSNETATWTVPSRLVATAVPLGCSYPLDTTTDAIPSTPPWQYPNGIPGLPYCGELSGECPNAYSDCCTATKCSLTFIGACMQTATLIDMACACPAVSATTCSPCMNSTAGKAQYYRWLNSTCGNIDSWDSGLPSHWEDIYTSLDIIQLGNGSCVDDRYGCVSATYYNYGSDPTAESLEALIEPYLNLPRCMWRDCYTYYQAWNASVLDWSSSAWVNTSTYPWLIDQYSPDPSIHLERTDVCGSAYKKACSGMCAGSKSDEAELLLWLNNTCTGSASFEKENLLPQNWTQTVAANCIKNDTSITGPDDVVAFPSCIDSACGDAIRLSANKSSEFYCILDPVTGRYATGSRSVVHVGDFCNTLSYPTTCNSSCTLAFDRRDWLTYLNKTCSATAASSGWTGLPGNWTNLLSIQVSDLRPWQTVVRSTSYWDTILCPSPESSLGVFAAVNIAMLLLTPILGRRTVVSKLTFGLLGKPHSQGWVFMGPLMAALQTAANAGNIALIKATPGYEDTDWKTLMMLWYTRPRLAWLVIFLILYQVDEAMYLSCAASTLTTEIILQILGSYVMGKVANHARVQGFYTNASAVAAVPHGADAMLMYVGAILWLVVIFFTLIAVGTSVVNVSAQILQVGRLIGLDVLLERRLQRDVQGALDQASAHHENFQRTQDFLAQNGHGQIAGVYADMVEHMATQIDGLMTVEKSLERLIQLVEGPERQYRQALTRLTADPSAAGEVDATAETIRDRAQKQLLILGPTLDQATNSRAIAKLGSAEVAQRRRNLRIRARENRDGQRELIAAELEELRIVKDGWNIVVDQWAKVEARLRNVQTKWQARTTVLSSQQWTESIRRKLKRIVIQTSLGMFASWGSQWLFWIGFVRLYVPDA
ncbi:hypothetical protein B0T19DRAFT_473131 [Cercophora scortea]|uniref:Uncharacterized protein n=1 Tax=Cercophora scortea TaxID=314031 RepID=A0AAE0IVS7_9PEZI|nr:hypothetical protein B0T19DRAFT_473131 [Cercophora scortea]